MHAWAFVWYLSKYCRTDSQILEFYSIIFLLKQIIPNYMQPWLPPRQRKHMLTLEPQRYVMKKYIKGILWIKNE